MNVPSVFAKRPIYLDGHATTPLAPEAEAAMAPWWRERTANAHSPHGAGHAAAMAVESARAHVADLIGAATSEIVFTSGATEANALAIIGSARAAVTSDDRRRQLVVSAIEHKSVLECAARMELEGFTVVVAPVTRNGVIDLAALDNLVTPDTLLISVMAANNEVGVIQPLTQVAEIARRYGALLHVDASQQAGKVALDVSLADLASLSSHKMYGPGGVGALFVSSAAIRRPEPLFAGGSQEQGLRPGTLPVPLIIGFGEAAKIAKARLASDGIHGRSLSEALVTRLRDHKLSFEINNLGSDTLPGSLSVRFVDCDAASLIARVSDTLSLAEGSACTSGQILPSHVLTAMGLSSEAASQTVRIFCSRYTEWEEICTAADHIAAAVRHETVANWTDPPVGSPDERRVARF